MSGLGTLGTGGAQSSQPPDTLGTGGSLSSQHTKYSGDWQDSILSAPQVPWGLADSVLSGLQATTDWHDSVLSAPQVPHGLSGASLLRLQVP